MAACPCGRVDASKKAIPLAACCGRYLDDFASAPAPDADALMRSRYSAYVLGRSDYVLATWHASMRPEHAQLEPGTKWLGLEVRGHRLQNDTHAQVEFVARYRTAGRGTRIHERSRFVLHAGRWYYVDGDLL